MSNLLLPSPDRGRCVECGVPTTTYRTVTRRDGKNHLSLPSANEHYVDHNHRLCFGSHRETVPLIVPSLTILHDTKRTYDLERDNGTRLTMITNFLDASNTWARILAFNVMYPLIVNALIRQHGHRVLAIIWFGELSIWTDQLELAFSVPVP